MNLILFKDRDFISPDRVELSGRRFDHITRVLKGKPGQKILCGRLNKKIGQATILSIRSRSMEMEVDLTLEPPPPLPLTLVLALPRPKMLRRIIESTTSLGVKQIYLVNSWRVEKSFWQSPLLEDENIEKSMILGLEQARDTLLPKVYKKRIFTRFVKQELPNLATDRFCITAHPKTSQICPSGVNQETVLVIGPEGGFIDLEVKTLEDHGFSTFSLGPRILKVETAVPYLISRLCNG
ncbi:16S rRNA (uracil(1498)-N(3))-methyltransferase [Desulfospira joergensenii]|uniref:16S rRNA (uracil(1498)-N(3))-methyltransferase n=1 Tax=Desulfospira joergensenii TaxID=53329 RepID=UPI0003B3CFC6|nr:16S rRNA (uracil(1498)-N(3))-methyltransferase [Desulfospira joergensenii]